jgi:SET domain-containing protein
VPRKGHTNTKLDKHKADKSAYTTEFTIDAFHYGNWTRFCNHKCNTPNAAPKAVYIDDRDPRRPLWVFFATRDIQASLIFSVSSKAVGTRADVLVE